MNLAFSLVLLLFCASRKLSEGKTCVDRDDIPKKIELQRLGIVIGIAGSSHSEVGTCLLKDDYGDIIGALEKEYRSVTELVEQIFHLWTAGKGATPVSWAGLVTCLRFAKLNRLADDIESAYCAKERHARHKTTDEGYSNTPTGLQSWITYAIATVGAIIVATYFVRYFTTIILGTTNSRRFFTDKIAARTATNSTKSTQQPARVANDGDTETNYVYIRDYWKLDQLTFPDRKLLKGDRTTVAIIDHGFSMEHRSLHDKFIRRKITGYNFVRDENGTVDTGKWYGVGETLHGTQIASIIGGCAFTRSDNVIIPAGVAPDTNLYLCRAVYPEEIENALQHLRDAKKVDVICISLTMDLNGVERIRNRLGELTQRDVVCVACAGNDGYIQEYAGFPAFNQNVLSVGALESKGPLSGMNAPSGINVYAPGENICVPSSENEGIIIEQGTSFSAAIVAGIILLLIQCAGTVNDDVRKYYHKVEFLKRLFSSPKENLCTSQCLRHPQRFLERLVKDKEYVHQLIHDHYDKSVCVKHDDSVDGAK